MRYVNCENAILKRVRDRKVLHLSCVVPGYLHPEMCKVATVTGGELLEVSIKESGWRDVIAGDVEKLSDLNLDPPYDAVVAGDVIEHVSNPGLMLDGIKKVLQGEIIITTPHAFSLPNYARFVFGRFRDGHEHVMTFNMDNTRDLLTRHGFEPNFLSGVWQ